MEIFAPYSLHANPRVTFKSLPRFCRIITQIFSVLDVGIYTTISKMGKTKRPSNKAAGTKQKWPRRSESAVEPPVNYRDQMVMAMAEIR